MNFWLYGSAYAFISSLKMVAKSSLRSKASTPLRFWGKTGSRCVGKAVFLIFFCWFWETELTYLPLLVNRLSSIEVFRGDCYWNIFRLSWWRKLLWRDWTRRVGASTLKFGREVVFASWSAGMKCVDLIWSLCILLSLYPSSVSKYFYLSFSSCN